MNWRRGLLLAGIHLVIAASILIWQEAQVWPMLKTEAIPAQDSALRQIIWQEGDTLTLNPCDGGFIDGTTAPQEIIAGAANLPVALMTGWHEPCTASPQLTSIVEGRLGGRTRKSEFWIVFILCAMAAIQWFLVGGFPLIQPRRWWWEPGAFITLCTAAAFVLVLIPGVRDLSKVPSFFALFAWLYWFGLLVWKVLRSGWRLIAHRTALIR